MSVQTVSDIATLKTVTGSTHEVAEVLGYYVKNDGGGGEFYWDSASTATDNGGTIIQATGVPTGRWIRIVDDKINAKWFGATGDGSTDDSVAVNKALSMIDDGLTQHVYFPTGIYRVESAAQTTIADKSDFVIEMDDDATFINDDFATGFTDADVTFSSGTVSVTTTGCHGYSDNQQVVMTGFTDPAYNGVFIINWISATEFEYSIPWTPTINSDEGKTRAVNFSQTLITLDECSNASIKFNFKGTVQDIAIQQRLGWIALKLQNGCSDITVNLKLEGLSYGIFSGGSFTEDLGGLKNSNITINAKHVGYPLALWHSGFNCTFDIFAEDSHRSAYVGAAKDSVFNMVVKNYDVTALLLANHYIAPTAPPDPLETTIYSCENLKVNIRDIGSDMVGPTGRIAQLVAILAHFDGPGSDIKNLDIDIYATNAKYVTPLLMRTYNPDHTISNVNVKGFIDRRGLEDNEMGAELILGSESSSSVSGTYSGINFLSWRVFNPDITITKYLSIDLWKLTDDINFVDLYSTSPRYISVPTGRRVVYTQQITSGTTASRPTLPAYHKGFEYFDTDLDRPVWWNGTTWVDPKSETITYATTSASYTTATTYISAYASSANQTVTLPDATTCAGKRFVIFKTDSSSNTVTVEPYSSQKIGFSDNVILRSVGNTIELISDGTNWLMGNYLNTVYTTNTTDTVTNTFLNTNYPIASYPIGTVINYYAQNRRFERLTSVNWASIITDVP